MKGTNLGGELSNILFCNSGLRRAEFEKEKLPQCVKLLLRHIINIINILNMIMIINMKINKKPN